MERDLIKQIVGDAYMRGYQDGLEMVVKYGIKNVLKVSNEVLQKEVKKMKIDK